MKNPSRVIAGIIIVVVISPGISFAQNIPDSLYFGQNPPGLIPEVFAPEIISLPGRFERVAAFSPDGKEFFFNVTNANWTSTKIWYSKFENGDWTSPAIAPFSETTNNAEPCFSPDGQRLYFTSNRPPGSGWNYDFWMIEKSDSGWTEPTRLSSAINTNAGEWHPGVVNDYSLYFARDADIYLSRFVNGNYQTAVNLGSPVNSNYADWDPYVSPDESYMIFKSDRPGGYGDLDLYISYKDQGGYWGTPINLGPSINTIHHDDPGDVTFDGKYLFFARRIESSEMDIYWVDVRAVIGVVVFDYTPHDDTENIIGPYNLSAMINVTEGNEILPETAIVISGMSANFTDTTALITGTEPGEYTGAIPGYGMTGNITYYLAIQDTSGMWFREPFDAPNSFLSFHVGPDSIPPEILSIDTLENTVYFDGSQEISCEVDDNISIKEVRFIWSKNGGNIDSLLLAVGDNPQHYSGTFTWAGAQTNDVFEYILRVVDDTQNQNVTDSKILVFEIATHVTIGKFEEQDLSQWDTGDGWGSIYINAAAGWGVNDSPGGTYSNNADNPFTLIEPMDLSLFDQAYLSFWQGYFLETGIDFGYIELSTDNTNWTPVDTVTGLNIFENSVINMEDYLGEDAVYVRFRLTSNESQTYFGWYVDDIELYVNSSPPVAIQDPAVIPTQVTLHPNYPNPFNATTTIGFSLPHSSDVELVIYDLLGREVVKLINGYRSAGNHSVTWNSKDKDGSEIASGIYIYHLITKDGTKHYEVTKKLVLLK